MKMEKNKNKNNYRQHDEIEEMITRCGDEARNLTQWENNFIESVNDDWTNRGWLSDAQYEKLEEIYMEKVD